MLVEVYELKIKIKDPESGDVKQKEFSVSFSYDEKQYGNGHSMYVKLENSNTHWDQLYDIRYDKTFSKDAKMQYITHWAFNNWSGENGSWKIVKLSIECLHKRVKQ